MVKLENCPIVSENCPKCGAKLPANLAYSIVGDPLCTKCGALAVAQKDLAEWWAWKKKRIASYDLGDFGNKLFKVMGVALNKLQDFIQDSPTTRLYEIGEELDSRWFNDVFINKKLTAAFLKTLGTTESERRMEIEKLISLNILKKDQKTLTMVDYVAENCLELYRLYAVTQNPEEREQYKKWVWKLIDCSGEYRRKRYKRQKFMI